MVSRVARRPIPIPAGVTVSQTDQQLVIKGKWGELTRSIPTTVQVNHLDHALQVVPCNDSIKANALTGTIAVLVGNMLKGVSEGFQRKLLLVGVGYRAKAEAKSVNLTIGFSHPVDFILPPGVVAETPSATEIILKGADKQQVFQVAANIRAIRPPEPYKGKGIRYDNEKISLKEEKKK